MSGLDWIIAFAMLAMVVVVAWWARRLSHSVGGYMVAERSAGRYLLVLSNGMAGLGAATIVGQFEMFYDAGLTANWWMLMSIPATMVIAISGWVYYRFRQTRAMTLGQFLGDRYSQRFRIFAGALAFVSGVINFGIFPAVGSRLVITIAELPEVIPGLGVPLQPVLMVGMVAAATAIVLLGGQVVIIITDLLLGAITMLVMLTIILFVWNWLNWGEFIAIAEQAQEGQSRLDPLDTSKLASFNIYFFLIGIVWAFYATMTFQGDTPYRAAPLSPHEAKMSAILFEWRGLTIRLFLLLLPLAAILVMEGGGPLGAIEASVNARLDLIDNEAVKRQMTVPVVVTELLPIGLRGLLLTLVFFAFLSTHDTYLHAWSSIFVQDVMLPLRQEPLSERTHVRALKAGVLLVAVLILLISLFVKPTEHLLKYMMLSASVFIAGAGATLIGGLYTKWGSTLGAWLALAGGACFSLMGIVMQMRWVEHVYPWLVEHAPQKLAWAEGKLDVFSAIMPGIDFRVTPDAFPVDGAWMTLASMAFATTLYVLGSWAQRAFFPSSLPTSTNLFLDGPLPDTDERLPIHRRIWKSLTPTPEYTRRDRVVWAAKILWTGGLCLMFLSVTTYGIFFGVADSFWTSFWLWYIRLSLVIAVGVTIWFLTGAAFDVQRFIRAFRRGPNSSDNQTT